jgi:hypothetical protein
MSLLRIISTYNRKYTKKVLPNDLNIYIRKHWEHIVESRYKNILKYEKKTSDSNYDNADAK